MVFRESQMCCETKLLLGSNKTKIVQAENFVNVHDMSCISNYLFKKFRATFYFGLNSQLQLKLMFLLSVCTMNTYT